jgi:hypothetical protein
MQRVSVAIFVELPSAARLSLMRMHLSAEGEPHGTDLAGGWQHETRVLPEVL